GRLTSRRHAHQRSRTPRPWTQLDAEITASAGFVVIAGDRHTPEDARRFAWCLLAAAGIADDAA
ncbi:hypothetical protein, partial [Rhodococcus aerolatus]